MNPAPVSAQTENDVFKICNAILIISSKNRPHDFLNLSQIRLTIFPCNFATCYDIRPIHSPSCLPAIPDIWDWTGQ